MLGDPYKQAQNWQEGTENEHFQIIDETLTLNFIEFIGINNPGTEAIVLAKITLEFNQTDQMNDFRTILDEFVAYLPRPHEIPPTETTSEPTTTTSVEESTTTPTTSKEETTATKETTTSDGLLTSGMTVLSTISLFLSLIIIRRTRQKN